VAPTLDAKVSHVTIVTEGEDEIVEQISKQLHKLIDVIKLTDLTEIPALHRELALIRVRAQASDRGEIFQVADVFRARVLDVSLDSMVMEITGAAEKIDDFLAVLLPYGVLEIARSGLISVEKGKKK